MQYIPLELRSSRALVPLVVLALMLLAQLSSLRIPGLAWLLMGALGLSAARRMAEAE